MASLFTEVSLIHDMCSERNGAPVKTISKMSCVLAFVSANAAFAQPAESFSGFDVLNTSPAAATQFQAEYHGMDAGKLLAFDTGAYHGVSVQQTTDGSVITWTDGSTPAGAWAHFGFAMNEDPLNTHDEGFFRYNSGPRGDPVPIQIWNGGSSGSFIDYIPNNFTTGGGTGPVKRRVALWDGPLSLADMVRGGAVWNQGIDVDPAFRIVPPGGLSYEYPVVPAGVWCVMMYDVLNTQTGQVDVSFYNAIHSTLCPSDFNHDGFVTGEDFDGYVAAFELGTAAADFNGDGFVTGEDFDAYVSAFEAGC